MAYSLSFQLMHVPIEKVGASHITPKKAFNQQEMTGSVFHLSANCCSTPQHSSRYLTFLCLLMKPQKCTR